ncbi:uncharacterized protein LOC128277155, partial [Anopheles cruzii]|uniref:uncharacterized protein LOC128277155 n=1 Tax=Anopheles cruzii TaxID=68878 RepID=UPI0022EC5E52
MKCAYIFVLVLSLFVVTMANGQATSDRLWKSLHRARRSQGQVNYGFPTFPTWGQGSQLGGGQGQGLGGFGQGGLFSRGDFADLMPDPSQFKGNQGWVTKSCVYDEKGKAKCVEKKGD